MTRYLHESANAVLYRALDLPAGDRQQFIAQATAGDQELFDDVRTMLSRIEQLDQFLEDPLELPVEQKPPAPVLPRNGELVGDWRVERELGRNGADLILLVRRDAGGDHERYGTMRLAQAASRTGQTTTRFERLRERLATLDHPAIARPVDAGSTADGRPYFVVDRRIGEPIDSYAAHEQLDLAARARLFARFCDAVHYMHQHLIVHRDLKPADMLVAPTGAVTLLDVGMIGDGWPVNAAYASPDQLAGQPLSVGSDIYSLGAVLYGLLTGRYAHGVDTGGVLRTAGRNPVMAPSDAVLEALAAPEHDVPSFSELPHDPVLAPGEALADQLRTHFDAILVRALAPEPAARQPSAHALARELEQAADRLEAPVEAVNEMGGDALAEVHVEADVEADVDGEPAPAPALPAHHLTAARVPPAPPIAPLEAPPAARRSPVVLAVAMLFAGFVAGVFAGPWLRQQGLLATPGAAPAASVVAGQVAGARQAAELAVTLTASVPQSARDGAAADASLRLGTILAEQGETEAGLAALRKALALHEAHAVMDGAADAGKVHVGGGDDAGAEAELRAAHAVYAAQLQATPADAGLHTGLLSIEMALAASQNAQKHGRDTVVTLAGLRRLAGAAGDPRIDLLEAWVQPRGTAAQAHAAAQPALAKIRQRYSDHPDAAQTRALARALTMAGEVAQRAKQGRAACADFDEATTLYEGLDASNRLNAYDKVALQRLQGLKQPCS